MAKLRTRQERRNDLHLVAAEINKSNSDKKQRPFIAVVLGDRLTVLPSDRVKSEEA